jgi:UDP-N-acetylmuramoyl-tripeptide--D-alanyl-D-alanine ligase
VISLRHWRKKRVTRTPALAASTVLALFSLRTRWRSRQSNLRRGNRARWYRRRRTWFALIRRFAFAQATFVGVTGSCGKTTTTELIGAVLSSNGKCRTRAGRNGLREVVRNVLTVDGSTKYCVQEVSGSYPGRISSQVRVLRPQIAVVTTVGSDHYTTFRSLEATAKEKGQLVEQLPRHGTAILNADDPFVRAMANRTRARVITYGRSPDADVRATDISSSWPHRLTLTVIYGAENEQIRTRLVGEHWTTSVLSAVACGIVCGIDLKSCAKAIEAFEPIFGRYSVHNPLGGAFYVFDHKAPYWTTAASFAFISNARAPRRTIVFGTISDYPGGASASTRYRRIAREALQVADRVIFVGPHASHVSKLRQSEFQDRLFGFQTAYEANAFVAENVVAGELIYLKGSASVDHLERIMLTQLDRVVCWRERCGRERFCPTCRNYRRPHPPPFGIAQC